MDSDNSQADEGFSARSHLSNGRIMLMLVIPILFLIVVFMIALHFYARWHLLRSRRRQIMRARWRGTNIIFTDPAHSNPPPHKLDDAVLKSLPRFVFSRKTHPEAIDCAVCLSEFEDDELGRMLPNCKHCFHVDCIDMWFFTHSTCPLCRLSVEPDQMKLASLPAERPQRSANVEEAFDSRWLPNPMPSF